LEYCEDESREEWQREKVERMQTERSLSRGKGMVVYEEQEWRKMPLIACGYEVGQMVRSKVELTAEKLSGDVLRDAG
jgi:hypothetical protein